jgi:hypothetical protein
MTSFPPDLGYELVNPPNIPGSGFRFGRGTVVHVSGSEISSPTIRTDDVSVARADGLMMGREYYDGLTITFDINIKTRGLGDNGTAAKALHRSMAQAWFTEDTGVGASRITPGEVSELYLTDDDRTLVTYGRPRTISLLVGVLVLVGFLLQLRSIRSRTNSMKLSGNTVPLPVLRQHLLVWYRLFIFPLNTFSVQVLDDFAIVDGNTETWLLTKIYGPISAPKVEITNYYTIETSSDFSLGPNEWLEIDPRPWSRKVMKNGTTPCAGKFTAQSRRISMQTLPPGVHRIVLRGNDPTGTARLETSWRNAWSTW